MLVFISSCGLAQNNTSDKQITAMLKEFYTKYKNELSLVRPKTPVDIYVRKLDSLFSIYCTSKFRKEAKEWAEDGHDLITNDYDYSIGIDPKTLSVIKDLTKSNEYIVSYTAHDRDPSGKEYSQQVTLHVTVVKEGESYKIDAVW